MNCCAHGCYYALVALVLFSPHRVRAQGQPKVREIGNLQLRKPAGRELGPAQIDVYRVSVAAGEFLQLAAQQRGVDVVLTIVDPAGKIVVTADTLNGTWGPEHAYWIAARRGVYSVRVARLEDAGIAGHYELELTALRKASPNDRTRIQAQSTFYAGVQKEKAGDRDSMVGAVQLYAQALSLWRRVGDKERIAATLTRMAASYSGQDSQKAVDALTEALSFYQAIGDRGGVGETMHSLGVVYFARNQKPKALELYTLALALRRAAGDIRGSGETLSNIGLCHLELNEPAKAQEFFSEALDVLRAQGDHRNEGTVLHNLGLAYLALGDREKALGFFGQALLIERTVNNRSAEALTLSFMAVAYSGMGENAKATGVLTQAMAIARAIGDRAAEGAVLSRIASAYALLGEKQKALNALNQALPIQRAVGDRSGEAGTLFALAGFYSGSEEPKKAIEFLEPALKIERDLGNRAEEASVLAAIANITSDLGEPKKALEFFKQALEIQHTLSDRAAEADTLENMARIHADLNEKQPAIDFYTRALIFYRALNDRENEAHVLNNLGAVYSGMYDKQKALELYTKALEIRRAQGDRKEEAISLFVIGRVYTALGQPAKALDSFNQVLSIRRTLGDRKGEGDALNNLGEAYSTLGDTRKALECFFEALPIKRELGDRDGEATTLNNIGLIYSNLGEKRKALDFYTQAISLRETGASQGISLSNVGALYFELGELEKALDFYMRALSLTRAAGDREAEAITVSHLAGIYTARGEHQKALELYNQNIITFTALGNRARLAATLGKIGGIHQAMGEKDKALGFYNQALPMMRAAGYRTGEAVILENIGAAHSALGNKEKALEFYTLSLPISRAVSDRSGEAQTLANLSSVFMDLKAPETAIWFGKQAVNVLQSIRRDNRDLSDDLKRSYEKTIESVYRELASLLVQYRRFGEAEEVLNLLKNKEASDFIRRDSVADQLKLTTLLGYEKKAVERYEQLVGEIVAKGQQKSGLLAKAAKEPLNAAERDLSSLLDQDLGAANIALIAFLREQEKQFAAGSRVAARTVEFREAAGIKGALQKLGPDVVAIYTLVTPDRYIAMLVTSGASQAYVTAIKESELNAKVFEFRQRLQNPNLDPLPLARELYRIVFPEGLRKDLDAAKAKTIMWSVDSTLRYIPMAALHDGSGYLVKRFRQSLLTPASLTRLTEIPQPVWQGVGFGVSEAKADFSALPSVPQELRSIFRQTPTGPEPIPGTVRLNADFTQAAFQNDLRQPRKSVVHIATHFDSRPGVAANSHLLLGDGRQLSLAEIEASEQLFDNVDVLTLSACSTAFTNRSEDGREVDSFGIIAQRLGAKAVIASLWNVSDEATARLMETTYRLRQQHPELGKGEALRKAQESMMTGVLRRGDDANATGRGVSVISTGVFGSHAGPGWMHPFYWAPFILIGNWK